MDANMLLLMVHVLVSPSFFIKVGEEPRREATGIEQGVRVNCLNLSPALKH